MRASRLGLIGIAGGAVAYALRSLRGRSGAQADESTPVGIERARQVDAAQEEVAAVADARPGEALEEVAADPADLVEAERELLTVEGEEGDGHRRRDQNAGVAAQEIAAAQVRARRNGEQV